MDLYLHDILIDKTGVNIFALKEDGTNVFVKVKNFKMYFYVGFDGDTSEELIRTDYMEKFKQEYWYRNVSSMKIVRQKRLVGFSDDRVFPFVKIEFENIFKFYMTRKALEQLTGQIESDGFSGVDTSKYPGMSVYESRSVDPTLKFFHSSGVKPSSYFHMEDYTEITGVYKKSHCTEEYSVGFLNISPVTEERKPPPLLICSYDLETSGLNPKEDFIFQVSMIFARLGSEISAEGHASKTQTDGVVICVGKTESLDETTIIEVDNELDLLSKFKDILIERGCNILCGYNTFHFDSQFLYKRAELYKFSGFKKLSFLKSHECELQEKTLESAAMGKNELKQIIIPGRVEIDLFMVMKRGYKLNSYKLNAVCDEFFGGNKDDISYADILEACTNKDPHKLGVIAKYCYQDSGLVLQLLDKIKQVYDATEMAKLCTVPLTYILGRGQQIKCMSLILNRVHNEYICNYRPKKQKVIEEGGDEESEEEGYKGASVIEAKKGFYEDDPIVTMDFASLYPSIMRRKNLCYTTHVTEDRYRGIEGVEYEDYEVSEKKDGEKVYATFAHRPGKTSILAELEEFLGKERKATKKLMKGEKDPFLYSLLDSKQKAQKVTMNSMYGFAGTVNHGMLPKVEIAAAVTYTGRMMIQKTQEFVEEKYNCTVVYGDTDSVMVIFPKHKDFTDRTEKLEYCFKMGTIAAKELSDIFGHPIELEFENIYYPYLLISKKRYAGLSWETVAGPPSMTMKGLVTVRRDNAPFVGRCASDIIHLMMDLDVGDGRSAARKHVTATLQKLEEGLLPVSDLTIRKELKKWEYKNPTTQGILAGKLKWRAREQRVFREFIRDTVENEGGYDDTRLKQVWSYFESLRDVIVDKMKREISMMELVEGVKNTSLESFVSKNGNADYWYKKVRGIIEKEEDTLDIVLISEGIGDSTELERRYMDFSKYDVVEWEAPKLGDRLPYVVTTGRGDVSNRAEDPRLISLGIFKPDTLYYIQQQISKPIIGLLEHVIDSPGSLFSDFQRRAVNKKMGRSEITSFFKCGSSSPDKTPDSRMDILPGVSKESKESNGVIGKGKNTKSRSTKSISSFFSPAKKQKV